MKSFFAHWIAVLLNPLRRYFPMVSRRSEQTNSQTSHLFHKISNIFVIKNLIGLIKSAIFQFVGISLLVGFLLFLLNILLGLSMGMNQLGDNVRNKLGVYLYIKDIPSKKDQIYSAVIKMKGELEAADMKVEYYSKAQAFSLLQKKIPDITQTFDKYGITNPLPATLYVIFDTNTKYESLKHIADEYSSIILNSQDISKGKSLKEQEKRILNAINLTSFLSTMSYFLIVILTVIILIFLLFVIRIKFQSFHKQIEVQKLLGATYMQIKLPFLLNTLAIVAIAFFATLVILSVFIRYTDGYVMNLFNFDIYSLIGKEGSFVLQMLLYEVIAMMILVGIVSNIYMNKLLKKI